MTRPRGMVTRYGTVTRINHWITAGCFVLLTLSGLAMFHPLMFWLSGLFGGGQWTRAVHPWIGIVLLISYAGMFVQFWRDNLWNRDDLAWMLAIDRVLANEEEGVPEVGRFNAGQKFVFWAMALLIPVLFFTGIAIWEGYFTSYTSIELQRVAVLIHSLAADCGDHRLDHPCLCRDLGQGLDAGNDSGLCDAWVGVAASPQMAAAAGGERVHRSAAANWWRRTAQVRSARETRRSSAKGQVGRQSARRREGAGCADPAGPHNAVRRKCGAAGSVVRRPSDARMVALHG